MTTTAVCNLIFGALLLGSIAYCTVIRGAKAQERFKGQVSGYLAGLASSGVFGVAGEYTARQVASLAEEELDRLSKHKGAPPLKDSDPFYYVQGECAPFSLLCIEKYARAYTDGKQQADLLKYCESHYISASKLHATYSDEW